MTHESALDAPGGRRLSLTAMPTYAVSLTLDVDADSPEAAAVEADRQLLTTRPKEFAVTPGGGRTVFVRVERGEAKRIA